ncbi:MAG TPA: hypothetical protein VF997_09700 [Polyangia bacterium]
MARCALSVSLVALLAGATGAAAADEREPPVAVAVGAGVGLAIVPLLAGGVLFASSSDDGLHQTAAFVAMGGLVVAPAVAHLVVREYKRAAIFAALPLAALIANVIVFQLDPRVTTYGSAESRVTFGVALTAATVGATVGLADTFGAADRWRARHRVVVAPAVGPGGGGVALGAAF